MALTDRQKKLVKLLLDNDDYKGARYYANEVGVSLRTFYYDLNKIALYLSDFFHEPLIDRKQGSGIKFVGDADKERQIIDILGIDIDKKMPFSVKERRNGIVKILLIDGETTTYQKLAGTFYTSKTSIAKDLEFIHSFFSGALRVVSNAKGTFVQGDENEIQESIKKYIIYVNKNISLNFRDGLSSDYDTLSYLFSRNVVSCSYEIIGYVDGITNHQVPDCYLKSLFETITILIYRASIGRHVGAVAQINAGDEEIYGHMSRLAKDIAALIEQKLKITLWDTDMVFLTSQLFMHKIETQSHPHIKYGPIVEKFIKEVSIMVHLNLCHDSNLFQGLLAHMVPMVQRARLGVKIENPLLEDIKRQYKYMLNITVIALSKLEELSQVQMTEDDISFLTIHILAAMERNADLKKVLIVCPTGIGTSELIVNKIRNSLPPLHIVKIVPLKEMSAYVDSVDFIISTVPIDLREKPVILVSPLLTDTDLKNIASFMNLKMGNIIAEQPCGRKMKFLPEIIDPQLIYTDCDFKDKISCLKYMIASVEERGYALRGFGESVLMREQMGSTALETGVAIPHAFPDKVADSAICIVTLSKPVVWDGIKVKVVLLICISNEKRMHLKEIFAELYSFISSAARVKEIFFGKNKIEIQKKLGGGDFID